MSLNEGVHFEEGSDGLWGCLLALDVRGGGLLSCPNQLLVYMKMLLKLIDSGYDIYDNTKDSPNGTDIDSDKS